MRSARVIERTWSLLLQEMRGEAVVRGLQREDKMLYPPFAVREALVNAVCHRDYRLPGRRVEIRQFDDRLEFSSPGGLARCTSPWTTSSRSISPAIPGW